MKLFGWIPKRFQLLLFVVILFTVINFSIFTAPEREDPQEIMLKGLKNLKNAIKRSENDQEYDSEVNN